MSPSGQSEVFALFSQAILNRQNLTCIYKGQYREVSPHILGHKDGLETALVYQFGGESARGLPPRGEWRCLRLADVHDAKLRDGQWHTGGTHRKSQRCVDEIYLDVNLDIPHQPGRRSAQSSSGGR